MDLIDKLHDISSRIPTVAGQLQTEEATKNALIMPFINALGYNVFDPSEVIPEFTADVGTKKGEKVDYAIVRDGKPIILFECKSIDSDLGKLTSSQLYRYFSVTDARLGVLTNGVHYQFFSDLESPNKMDSRPFLEVDLRNVNEEVAAELKRYAKEFFNLESILSTASELKYLRGIKRVLGEEWVNPSEDFVRLLAGRVYSGQLRKGVMEQFTVLVKRAFQGFVSDHVNMRLKSALQGTSDQASAESEAGESSTDMGVETTEDEVEAFYIVKAIARQAVDPRRVIMRDTQSYCGVLLDDNNRKPLCRLYFNSSQKYLGFFDDSKNLTKHKIDDVNDIYRFGDDILAGVARYEASS